jgi:calcium/calmodulin-dependent protein kinase I
MEEEAAHNCIVKKNVEDDFDLIEEVGQGQYATVHLANKTGGAGDEIPEEVAVKLIDKKASGMSVTDKEIAVMMRIDDPNCVKLYRVYETDDEVQMVLEYLQGSDLFDRIIQKQKYDEADAKKLMKKVCMGVNSLHQKNIMHRDLKPENILLVTEDDDIDCKVADFGLSRLFPEGGPREQKTGTLCGTPGYVAPEVLNRTPYSYKVDVWSLGVITYITCCGFPPFPLDMQADSVAKVKSADYSFPSPYWDSQSEDCKDFIKKMIVMNPEERASMEQVLAHPWLADA